MVFVESQAFTKAVSRLPDDDYAKFQQELGADPETGDVMSGCGGFRKARMAFPSAGIGKSGGARVIYLHVPENETIYLVYIYGKSSKSSLTKSEQNELRKIAGQIRDFGRA
jgi:hypothetical protein